MESVPVNFSFCVENVVGSSDSLDAGLEWFSIHRLHLSKVSCLLNVL